MSAISKALSPLPQQFVFQERGVSPLGVNGLVQLCAANPLRWALVLSAPILLASHQAAGANLSTDPVMAAAQTGIPLSTGMPIYSATFRDYGILVQQAWYGFCASFSNVGGWYVMEVLIQQ